MKDDEAVGQLARETACMFPEIHPPLSDHQALIESERCLQCGGPHAPAPCVSACPSKVDVPKFIHQILGGNARKAGETVFEANVLGGSCARVCPVDELCEGECVMHREGRRPVEIGRLQRYATDAALAAPQVPVPAASMTRGSVGVIGCGPAGLACAASLVQQGHAVTVYERRELPGGLVTYAIAPYKQVVEPIPAETERVRRLGVDIRFGVEIGKDIAFDELSKQHDAIFLGAGMGDDTPANLAGQEMAGVWESLPFIEALKLSTPPPVGRKVVVIGGGNTALDVVREAVRMGADEVTLLYRRDEDQMPAYRHEVEAAKSEGVRFMFLTAPVMLIGNGQVTGIECQRMELGEPDSSGRPRPVVIPNSNFVIEADTVVTAIGQRPREDLLKGLGVETKWGTVLVDERHQTSKAGIFAGGDCINGGATVVEAVADGKAAAESIHAFLTGQQPAVVQRETVSQVLKEGPLTKHYQHTFYLGTSTTLCKGCNLCVFSCPTQILLLDAKSKIQVSDIDKCVFCGICEARCPDFAIWISKDSADHPVEAEAMRRLAV